MPSFPSSDQFDTAQPAWQAIERLIEEVTRLSREDCDEEAFYRGLLARLLPAMAADLAAVWLVRDGRISRFQHAAGTGAGAPAAAVSAQCVQQSVEAGRPLVVTVARSDEDGEATLFVIPVDGPEQVIAALEVQRTPPSTDESQQGFLELLATFAEAAADFHCRRQLRALSRRNQDWEQFGDFLRRIHQRLDLSATCFTIANEARRLVGCDRLSVLVRRHGTPRVYAVSGVDLFDRRSDELRRMQRLVLSAMKTGDPLWFDGDSSEQPPEIEKQIQNYADVAGPRAMAVLPLLDESSEPRRRPQPLGALVFEWFGGAAFEWEQRSNMAEIARHAQLSVRNALELSELPLLWASRLLRACGGLFGGRRLPRSLFAVVIVAGLLAAALLVKTDFAVPCRGELQPSNRRDVFAPADGSITLRVAYGDRVRQDDLLLELHNPDLEFEQTRILGEIQTTESQLNAVIASSSSMARSGKERPDLHQLGADQQRLKATLRGLEQQLAVLQRQRQRLQVRSPIDGQVLTWNLTELLESRPVQHGQKLLSVADPDGPWLLEVHVPGHEIGHVLAARQHEPSPRATFFLATDPAAVHQGRIQNIALSSEPRDGGGTGVLVTVAVDSSRLGKPRPGAGVVAKIHCGRRSLAYVWLRDVIEVIRTRLLF